MAALGNRLVSGAFVALGLVAVIPFEAKLAVPIWVGQAKSLVVRTLPKSAPVGLMPALMLVLKLEACKPAGGALAMSPNKAFTAPSPRPCALANAAKLLASGRGAAVVMTANWSPKDSVCKPDEAAAGSVLVAVLALSSFVAARSCRSDLLSRSRIKPANSFPFMGVDKVSSTPDVAAGAALVKALETLLVEKFRLLSMLIPCSLVILTAANGWRGALY